MIHLETRALRGARLTALCTVLLLAVGCATDIAASRTFNPPPTEPFSAFGSFELQPATIAPEAHQGAANERAFTKIQENLELNVGRVLQTWETARDSAGTRTLVITPHVRELKFVSAGARVFGGAMRGSSAVVLELTLTDQATGEVVAEPEFFQRAAAMGGNWSVGGTDNHMLARITQVAAQYLENNYAKAVGGPTGSEAAAE